MRVIDVYHKDVHVVFEASMEELDKIIEAISHSQITYDGKNEPKVKEAVTYFTDVFCKRLIETVDRIKGKVGPAMALDATAREANVRDSIKKYMVDNLYTAEGLQLTFDRYLTTPNIQGHAIDKWVSINFGGIDASEMSVLPLSIYCCCRSDSEGFKLAQLRDTVMGYLTDTTQTDCMARIPLYRSRADAAWTLLDGGIIVHSILESEQFEAEDGTKFKILTARLRWSAKI